MNQHMTRLQASQHVTYGVSLYYRTTEWTAQLYQHLQTGTQRLQNNN